MQQKDNITQKQRKLMSEIRDYDITVSILEKMIIDKLRSMSYGNLIIFITDGVPGRVEIKKSEMLTPDSFNRGK